MHNPGDDEELRQCVMDECEKVYNVCGKKRRKTFPSLS